MTSLSIPLTLNPLTPQVNSHQKGKKLLFPPLPLAPPLPVYWLQKLKDWWVHIFPIFSECNWKWHPSAYLWLSTLSPHRLIVTRKARNSSFHHYHWLPPSLFIDYKNWRIGKCPIFLFFQSALSSWVSAYLCLFPYPSPTSILTKMTIEGSYHHHPWLPLIFDNASRVKVKVSGKEVSIV